MADPEIELMTMGLAVECPTCHKISYVYPKGTGFQPYIWEMNCCKCHLFYLGLDGYIPGHKTIIEKLEQLRGDYIQRPNENVLELNTAINDLAEKFDHVLNNKDCECGARISIAAKPKCMHCGSVVFDSFFHYADGAPM